MGKKNFARPFHRKFTALFLFLGKCYVMIWHSALKHLCIFGVIRAFLKIVNMPRRSIFFCKTRQFDAGILGGFQGKLTQYCEKKYEFGRVAHFSETPYFALRSIHSGLSLE